MKKKIIVLGLCTLMVCGCGKTIPTLSNGDEAVVTFENGDMISVNDLYNDLKDNYALDSLVNLIDKKILEDKYKDNLDSANEYADSTMDSLETNYGDDLLTAIQTYTSYSTIEAYRNYVYLSYLQNLAVEDYAKEQITDKEIKSYYKKNIYGDILVDHILVTPNVADDATDDEKTAAEDEAKEKINTIIAKLKESSDVKTTFTELAKEYSEDESTKEDGGSLGYINDGTLSSSYDEILEAALKLKDGEYSTEVITTELGYHVILREASKEKAALEDVEDSIRETLANDLLTDDSTISTKAMQALRKSYGVDIIDSEIQSQYATYIQNALASTSSN
jgi:foldase protein PrsA